MFFVITFLVPNGIAQMIEETKKIQFLDCFEVRNMTKTGQSLWLRSLWVPMCSYRFLGFPLGSQGSTSFLGLQLEPGRTQNDLVFSLDPNNSSNFGTNDCGIRIGNLESEDIRTFFTFTYLLEAAVVILVNMVKCQNPCLVGGAIDVIGFMVQCPPYLALCEMQRYPQRVVQMQFSKQVRTYFRKYRHYRYPIRGNVIDIYTQSSESSCKEF